MLSLTLRIRHRSLPPFLIPRRPLANHLKIEVWAVHGASNYDGPCLWSIEPLPEYAVIDQCFDFPVRNSSTMRRRLILLVSALTARALTPMDDSRAAMILECSTDVAKISVGQSDSMRLRYSSMIC